MTNKIDSITQRLMSIRDNGVKSRSDCDALAAAASKLQGFARQWDVIFAAFNSGDDLSGDGFIDLNAEQIEACIALTK